MDAVRVGIAGAGPWAGMFHAPMLGAGPHTTVSAVYGRRREAADELAGQYDAYSTDDFEDFLAHCDAVSFALPPDVQAALAPVAAAAGKPLLLEKPIALDLDGAQELAAAVEGVPTQLMLTRRYARRIRGFLEQAHAVPITGLRTSFVSGAFLPGSPFATPWRLQHGALLDVGPHVLDLMDAVAGRIERIEYTGDPATMLALTTRHESGAIGQAFISSVVPGYLADLEVFGPEGILSAPDRSDEERAEVMATIAAEFAHVVRTGRSHELDVHRGLYLQELIAALEP
ncbi:MAG: Gfo/Idh/MocA family oxidoreductase [Actinobacteria bacterium]|nr:Gfo/Idh/MocA family oxidoreductase [Actinomycetota bacterium]MCB8997858.1 Gfo/Idh/MocA family oxidoreductase [Actinomycetota bacterium]MCB9414248.1 Gfo/Idh/MocA family oxidoreductase [Actinomycetota bacterium]MCB9423992.1 Gfo/Idh/MocA family oxidoreductase [Actinomycetota bacterium]HRY09695.1 Gfo/Idh/MocA family oxidoreductase [Candidatus Nanopelagicales bacterium]